MHWKNCHEAENEFDTRVRTDFSALPGAVSRQYSQEQLRERIVKFLSANCIGTLATCHDNEPRATPVRYRNSDLTIYVHTEGGGKLYNLCHNPRVSFSVSGNYSGFKTVRGLQLWGTASIIASSDREAYQQALQVLRPDQRADLQQIDTAPMLRDMYVIRIVPDRLRFLSFPQGILNRDLLPQTQA